MNEMMTTPTAGRRRTARIIGRSGLLVGVVLLLGPGDARGSEFGAPHTNAHTITEPPAASAACASDPLGTPGAQRLWPVIADTTPRPQQSLAEVLAELRDPRRSDGTLIVGVKETTAARGVSSRGVPLPLAARDSAVAAIRRAFPELPILHIGRTAILVRAPHRLHFLQALRARCVVDYLEANHTNGVVGSSATRKPQAPSASLSESPRGSRSTTWGAALRRSVA